MHRCVQRSLANQQTNKPSGMQRGRKPGPNRRKRIKGRDLAAAQIPSESAHFPVREKGPRSSILEELAACRTSTLKDRRQASIVDARCPKTPARGIHARRLHRGRRRQNGFPRRERHALLQKAWRCLGSKRSAPRGEPKWAPALPPQRAARIRTTRGTTPPLSAYALRIRLMAALSVHRAAS